MSSEKHPQLFALVEEFDGLVYVEKKKEALDKLRQLKGLVESMESVDFQSLESTEQPLITRLRLVEEERKRRLLRRQRRKEKIAAKRRSRDFWGHTSVLYWLKAFRSLVPEATTTQNCLTSSMAATPWPTSFKRPKSNPP
ncbi:hypothetical protein GJ744_009463 [Endocarpon pusillum]|uniref:Uncharacterized protein n=1 Tax=Endocarpon pusillum TaxID=364733 RepID=A0A8H7E635_9EURO|nr:hypothetical protein GJ744_009463 [Endocarpon pusillum]